jgi:homoserine dehydrogenase
MGFQQAGREPLPIRPMARVRSPYYLRMPVVDQPGVLADIAGILGHHGISIARVVQDGRGEGRAVSLVMMTHRAEEAAVQAALGEIQGMDCVQDAPVLIRVESDED